MKPSRSAWQSIESRITSPRSQRSQAVLFLRYGTLKSSSQHRPHGRCAAVAPAPQICAAPLNVIENSATQWARRPAITGYQGPGLTGTTSCSLKIGGEITHVRRLDSRSRR